MTAQRFAKQRFAFSPRTVLTEQAPVVLSVIARELGVLGIVFLAAGLVAIVGGRTPRDPCGRRRARHAGDGRESVGRPERIHHSHRRLAVAAVAVGADAVKRVVESPRVMRAAVAVVATVAISAIPVRNVLANYTELDRSSQLEEGRFFRSLFAQLPDRAAIVAEDYFFDMALLYHEVTGEGGPGRGIGRIPFDPASCARRRGAAVGSSRSAGRPRFLVRRACRSSGRRLPDRHSGNGCALCRAAP